MTVLALGAALTACFEDGPVTAPSGVKLPPVATTAAAPSGIGTATSTTTGTTTSSTSVRATSARATTSSLAPSTSARTAPSGTMLSDLRMGRHDGFDRLVLQFTGDVPPHTVTREAGPITECGSGLEAGGPGEYLVLTIEPIALFDDEGKPAYTGANTVAGPGGAISRAIVSCAFEGRLQVAVKLAGSGRRYADSTLTGPSRIVLDVRQ